MKKFLYLILISIAVGSCEQEPVLEYSTYKPVVNTPTFQENIKKFPLEIIWQKRLNPYVTSELYHTTSDAKVHISDNGLSVFYNYDKFSFWSIGNGDNITNKSASQEFGDDIYYHPTLGAIISSHRKIIAIDKNGKETILYNAPDSIYINHRTNFHGDDFYFSDDDYFEGTSSLYKVNVQTKKCELVTHMDGEKLWGNDYKASIALPVFFEFNGEEYELSSYTKTEGFSYSMTYSKCKKLSDGTILWEKDDLFTVGQSNLIVYQNDIILNGYSSLYRVSILNGNIIWKFLPSTPGHSSPNDISVHSLELWENKLVFVSRGRFMELNLNTGIISYSGPLLVDEEATPAIVIANGTAYWSAYIEGKSYLWGLKLSDHAIVVKGLSPNYGISPYGTHTKFVNDGLQVDVATNIGYISDGYFIYCMKLL